MPIGALLALLRIIIEIRCAGWALSGVVCVLAQEYFLVGYGVFSWVSNGILVVRRIWFVGVFPLGGMGVQTLSGVA